MRAMARNLASSWPKVALSTLVLVLLVAHRGAVDAQEGASRGRISGNNLNGQFFPAILLCLLALANRAEAGGGSGLLIGLANVSKCVNYIWANMKSWKIEIIMQIWNQSHECWISSIYVLLTLLALALHASNWGFCANHKQLLQEGKLNGIGDPDERTGEEWKVWKCFFFSKRCFCQNAKACGWEVN